MTPTLLLLTGALVIAVIVLVDQLAERDLRIAELERDHPGVTTHRTAPLRPGVKPRRPVFAGHVPAPSAVPTLEIDLVAWDAEVEGLPIGHMADASPVRFEADGTIAPIHPRHRNVYRPAHFAAA